ncbi:hypothetical protein FQR65_LT11752 [Abscondita terminalis]|nr:hypothetical protein FQR65_LT11752 [Abscondita terminalis]
MESAYGFGRVKHSIGICPVVNNYHLAIEERFSSVPEFSRVGKMKQAEVTMARKRNGLLDQSLTNEENLDKLPVSTNLDGPATEIYYLKQQLIDKCDIINNQRDLIVSLKSQIELLKSSINTNSSIGHRQVAYADKRIIQAKSNSDSRTIIQPKPTQTNPTTSTNLQKMNEIVNINNDIIKKPKIPEQPNELLGLKTIQNKKKHLNKTMLGSSTEKWEISAIESR